MKTRANDLLARLRNCRDEVEVDHKLNEFTLDELHELMNQLNCSLKDLTHKASRAVRAVIDRSKRLKRYEDSLN